MYSPLERRVFKFIPLFVNWFLSQLNDLEYISYSFDIDSLHLVINKTKDNHLMTKDLYFDEDSYTYFLDVLSDIDDLNNF